MDTSKILDDSRIYDAWKLFTTKGIIKREVLRDKIVFSWARSRLSGIAYHDSDILLNVVEKEMHFISIPDFVKSKLDDLNVGFALLNSHGIVIGLHNEKAFPFKIDLGNIFEESKVGTWSYHLASQSEQYECVTGSEHYIADFHQVNDFTLPFTIQGEKVFGMFTEAFAVEGETCFESAKALVSQWVSTEGKSGHENVQNHRFTSHRNLIVIDGVGQVKSVIGESYKAIFNHHNLHHIIDHFSLKAVFSGKSQIIKLKNESDKKLLLLPLCRERGHYYVALIDIDGVSDMMTHYQGFRPIYSVKDLVGDSTPIQKVIKRIQQLCDVSHPILITGEKGTGKKVVAQCLHSLGNRQEKPFIWLDCSKVHHARVSRLLFGTKHHEIGMYEMAQGGTLYLDRANELLESDQKRLLHLILRDNDDVLQGKDVRVVFGITTDELSESLHLMPQLTRHLALSEIKMPKFAQRHMDFNMLAKAYLDETGIDQPRIGEQLNLLNMYPSVTNAHAIRHAALGLDPKPGVKKTDTIAHAATQLDFDTEEDFNLESIEMKTIVKALIKTNYNMSEASKILGLGRTTLYRKIDKYNISLETVK